MKMKAKLMPDMRHIIVHVELNARWTWRMRIAYWLLRLAGKFAGWRFGGIKRTSATQHTESIEEG